jgi:hypothetical protein
MAMKRSWTFAFAILACLMFAWATGAGRPYPANAGGVIDPTCSSSSPCIEYDNNSTGPGIRGISLVGNGLSGSTKNKSTSTTNGRAGLMGNDVGTGLFNSGVHGLSVNGTGVSGNSSGGVGVQGTGATGVQGIGGGASGTGVEADSSSGPAILANSNGGYLFYGTGSSGPAFVADSFGNTFTYGRAEVNNTVSAYGPTYGVAGVVTGTNSGGAGVLSETDNPQSWIFLGYSVFHSAYTFDVADDGTVFAKAYESSSAARTLQKTSTGRTVDTYAPQVSQPTLEDFGEAQLVNGVANVALEPRFADAIDRTASYLVTVTPEGDCRGLYVAQRNGIGFAVRELQGGRSSLAFAYRIVAKPFGDTSARLPVASMPRGFTPHSERPPQPRLPRRP